MDTTAAGAANETGASVQDTGSENPESDDKVSGLGRKEAAAIKANCW